MQYRSRFGFTLIELVIILALVVIITTLAIPSFQSIINNNQIITTANNLASSLYLARSEALKRGVTVSVCASADQNFDSCGQDWHQGWIVFVNPNDQNSIDDLILRVTQVKHQHLTITPTPVTGKASYQRDGFPSAASSNLNFNLTSKHCSADNGRSLTLTPTGRIQLDNLDC
jgi:type IV fimbrial biogenesis protein FimT